MGHCFMGQLREHGKYAVAVAMGTQNAHRPVEVGVLEHQGGVYQIDRLEERSARLDVRDVQLESGNATCVALPRPLDVLRVDVYPDEPVDAAARGTLEAVATRATHDGDAGRGISSQEGRQLMHNEVCLADCRQRHMRLIVG